MKELKEYLKRQTPTKENKHWITDYLVTGTISATQKNRQKENLDSAANSLTTCIFKAYWCVHLIEILKYKAMESQKYSRPSLIQHFSDLSIFQLGHLFLFLSSSALLLQHRCITHTSTMKLSNEFFQVLLKVWAFFPPFSITTMGEENLM